MKTKTRTEEYRTNINVQDGRQTTEDPDNDRRRHLIRSRERKKDEAEKRGPQMIQTDEKTFDFVFRIHFRHTNSIGVGTVWNRWLDLQSTEEDNCQRYDLRLNRIYKSSLITGVILEAEEIYNG